MNLTPAQYLSILYQSKEASAIYISEDLHIGYVNAAMLDLWQKEPDILEKPLDYAVPELSALVPLIKNVWRSGSAYTAKNVLIHGKKGGLLEEKYFDFEYRAILDVDGNTYAIIHTASEGTCKETKLDLAEQNASLRKAQENLLTSNKKWIEKESNLRGILLQAPIGICILSGPDHIIEVANDAILQVWGRKREDVEGKPHHLARPELEGQPVYEFLDGVYRTGETRTNQEFKVILPNNEGTREVYVNSIYKAIKTEEGEITGVVVILDEITEEVKMRQLAQRSQEMMNLAITAGQLGTFYLDPNRGIFSGNEQLKSWFGLVPGKEEELSQAISAIIPEDRQRVFDAINMALDISSGGTYECEYTIKNPLTNQQRMVKAIGKVRFGDDLKAISLNGTLQDITESKRDEHRKNDFIAMVSHELKTPITSLNAYIQFLQLKNKEHQANLEILAKAARQIKKMTTLIDGFLNLSRLESGKIHLEIERFDIIALIAEIHADVSHMTATHRISFSQDQALYVEADRNKIGQVLINLLSNAIKYSEEGKHILIESRHSEEEVIISVEDFGAGISKEDSEKLFERFYRADNALSNATAGFGIGLYICSEIIQRHQGKIWLESEPGHGSTFYFSLPIKIY